MELPPVSPRARLLVPAAAGLALLSPALTKTRAAAATALRLTQDPDSVVRALSLPLGDDAFPGMGKMAATQTVAMETSPYSMVALSWRGDEAPLWVRTRTGGAWGDWRRLALLTDLPDPDSGEGNGTRGTELLWVGRSDGVQVGLEGRRPDDLRLELIDPGVLPGDDAPDAALDAEERSEGSGAGTTSGDRDDGPTQPNLHYREQWGADETWRTSSPQYNNTIQQVHVHHTATGNDYEWADVPPLLRGIYRYHTQTLGWSDIGYNFLVDKFGRVWVGRAGGVAKPVRGAHTLGFNDTSVGVAMVGSYDDGWPWDKALTGVVMLAAWKLAMYDRKPTGWIPVYSHGSDRYDAGQVVTLPVIDGHRDTNETECPGQHLYDKLPEIRDRAQKRVDAG